jgi:hypothetical protein
VTIFLIFIGVYVGSLYAWVGTPCRTDVTDYGVFLAPFMFAGAAYSAVGGVTQRTGVISTCVVGAGVLSGVVVLFFGFAYTIGHCTA